MRAVSRKRHHKAQQGQHMARTGDSVKNAVARKGDGRKLPVCKQKGRADVTGYPLPRSEEPRYFIPRLPTTVTAPVLRLILISLRQEHADQNATRLARTSNTGCGTIQLNNCKQLLR